MGPYFGPDHPTFGPDFGGGGAVRGGPGGLDDGGFDAQIGTARLSQRQKRHFVSGGRDASRSMRVVISTTWAEPPNPLALPVPWILGQNRANP